MQVVVNSAQMKACDQRTIEYYQMPSMVLMERAALAVAEEIMEGQYERGCIGIFCSVGNNGGDGLAVARLLHQKNYPVRVLMLGKREKATEQTTLQLQILEKYQIPVHWLSDTDITDKNVCSNFTLLVDALFGVGLSRGITGSYAAVIQQMNESGIPILAVDMPSGIDASTGRVMGCAVHAVKTITFGFYKTGLLLYPGAEYAGTVAVRDVGITEDGFSALPELYTCDTDEILSMLPRRPLRSNKGTFGRVVLAAGCEGMAGAAYLAGIAAYRSGCGLVQLVTPEANRPILQTLLPEAVLTTYNPEQPDEELWREAFCKADAIGIGPGLGKSPAARKLLQFVCRETKAPLLVDGDGLNLFSEDMTLLSQSTQGGERPVILTPHLGEMSRLTGKSISNIQEELIETADNMAKQYPVVCVLKDARTIVAAKGTPSYINRTGNPGMAVGGSGDLLAGMICGLLAQGMEAKAAAVAGVHLHGRAGDTAAETHGQRAMTARDIADCIPAVLR